MSFLVVSPLSRLEETAHLYKPSHMITLINAGVDVKRPATVNAQNHLYLNFNDISRPISGLVSPQMAHIKRLIDHAQHWQQSGHKEALKHENNENLDSENLDSENLTHCSLKNVPSPNISTLQNVPPTAPMLIHCQMGISRSTAAAYIIAAFLNPKRREDELAQALRQVAPSATPNMGIIALADEFLGRQGRMIEAIQAIGRGQDAFEGTPFKLNLDNN